MKEQYIKRLKIAVCIKQVPDSTAVRIDPEKLTLKREGAEGIINPYDVHAIEEAVKIKSKIPADITVLSMGPPAATIAIKEALSFGADRGWLLCDKEFAGSDTWATSLALSKAIKKFSPHLIICGKQATDGDTAQVGPELAAHLEIPHASYVKKIEKIESNYIIVRSLHNDAEYKIKLWFPALITVVKEINEPRNLSLFDLYCGFNEKIKIIKSTDIDLKKEEIGLAGSPTKVRKIQGIVYKKQIQFIKGNIEYKADMILKFISKLKTQYKADNYTEKKQVTSNEKLPHYICIIGEIKNKKVATATSELCSCAYFLGKKSKLKTAALFLTNVIPENANTLPVDEIYILKRKKTEKFNAELFEKLYFYVLSKISPAVILGSATSYGRSLLPRLAVKFKTGLTADCTQLDIDKNRLLYQIRPAFSGNVLATIVCPHHKPAMATVRPNVLKKSNLIGNPHILIENLKNFKPELHSETISIYKKRSGADITNMDIILAGGRGLENKKNFSLLIQIAKQINAGVGASRFVVDAGWADYSYQIGQTGKTVQPELYIAFGISGAIQHIVGMQAARNIIAINIDKSAPIFNVSNFGIVEDAPLLLKTLLKLLTEKNHENYSETKLS